MSHLPLAAAYHDGITVTLTTSRLFRLAKVMRWLTLAFSDIGHVSQVWSHSVMCWELKNGVKDVTSDNFLNAIAISFFTFKVKSLRAFNPCVMIQYQNRWKAGVAAFYLHIYLLQAWHPDNISYSSKGKIWTENILQCQIVFGQTNHFANQTSAI